MVVITIIAILAAILLPALARAREQARRMRCASNMQQIGMIALMYANEHDGIYPPGATNQPWGEPNIQVSLLAYQPRQYPRNNYIMHGAAIYPDYAEDFDIFICPSSSIVPVDGKDNWYRDMTMTARYLLDSNQNELDSVFATPENLERFVERASPDPECLTNQNYIYLPYPVVTNAQALFLWDELDRRMAQGEVEFMHADLTVPGNHAPGGNNTYFRMRVNSSRFFIENIDDPGRGLVPDTQIPVLFDAFAIQGDVVMNHVVPVGGNVLYLDGHVDFMKYSRDGLIIPFNESFISFTRINSHDNSPLINVPPWCGNRLPGTDFEPRYSYYPNDSRYDPLR